MSELVEAIIFVIFIVLGVILGVLGATNWFVMHQNTIDGNSFRLARPFSSFDSSNFNERGNQARGIYLKVYWASFVWFIAFVLFKSIT